MKQDKKWSYPVHCHPGVDLRPIHIGMGTIGVASIGFPAPCSDWGI